MLVVDVIDADCGELMVIHYTTPTSVKDDALLEGKRIVMEEFVQIQEEIERVQYKAHVHVYSPQEAIRRARSRLDEQKYNIFSNNCESLVNWALTDQDVTDQGTEAAVGVGVGAAVGVGVVAAVGYTLWALFGGSNKDKKDTEKH